MKNADICGKICQFLPDSYLFLLSSCLDPPSQKRLQKSLEEGRSEWIFDAKFYELAFIQSYVQFVPFHHSYHLVMTFLDTCSALGKVDILDWFFRTYVWWNDTIDSFLVETPTEFYYRNVLKNGMLFGHVQILEWLEDHGKLMDLWNEDPEKVFYEIGIWYKRSTQQKKVKPWLQSILDRYHMEFLL